VTEVKTNFQPIKLSKNEIFGVLQNDRRRYILEILREEGNQSIRSLSEKIAYLETGTEDIKSNIRKSIYISLLQTHIPKMESLGIITYNREEDNVKLLPESKIFDVYIETVKKGDITWSQYYLGMSILALFGDLIISEGLIDWFSTSQWFIFISLVFLGSSIVNLLHVRKLEE